MADLDVIMSVEQRHIDRNLYRSRLIKLVRTNPILWDKKSPEFNQRTVKIKKWTEISKQLGVSTDKLRRTWENLRDQYRRDLKRTLALNIRSKWRFFDDMNFIRKNIRIKGSSFGEGDNSDTESESEDRMYVNPMVTLPIHSAVAENATAMAPSTFYPIQLSTEWKQQDQQLLKQQLLAINQLEYKEQQRHIKNLEAINQQLSEPQSCDSSEEQKSDCSQYVIDNDNIPQLLKIEIDSETSANSNHEVALPLPIIAQRQIPLSQPQPSTSTPHNPIPTSSHNDSEACVTTTANSKSTKRSRRRLSTIDTPTEDECQHSSLKNQRQRDTLQDTNELQDDDYHFVMSILPALRQVTRNRKFPLRSQIMTLISKELEENND